MAEETETPTGPEEAVTQGMDLNEDGDENKEEASGVVDEPKRKRSKRRNVTIKGRRVQVFGKKKMAIAMALCGDGYGMIRINGVPIDLYEPRAMRLKLYEPLLLVGKEKYQDLDIYIRAQGGGKVAQIYACRQAIAKALLAFHAKHVDEASKTALRETFLQYDRNLLVADPRRRESKKFGGPGARARYQKSYR